MREKNALELHLLVCRKTAGASPAKKGTGKRCQGENEADDSAIDGVSGAVVKKGRAWRFIQWTWVAKCCSQIIRHFILGTQV